MDFGEDADGLKKSHSGERRYVIDNRWIRFSRGSCAFGLVAALFVGYLGFVSVAHRWGIFVPQGLTPFWRHPPRTAPLHEALAEADRLEVIDMTPTKERMNPNGTVTTMTVLVEENRLAVQEFVSAIKFVEDPHKFVVGSMPYHQLNFSAGEKQLEKVYIEGPGLFFMNWASPRGGYSQLTPESSKGVRRWLEERGVAITD